MTTPSRLLSSRLRCSPNNMQLSTPVCVLDYFYRYLDYRHCSALVLSPTVRIRPLPQTEQTQAICKAVLRVCVRVACISMNNAIVLFVFESSLPIVVEVFPSAAPHHQRAAMRLLSPDVRAIASPQNDISISCTICMLVVRGQHWQGTDKNHVHHTRQSSF